MDVVCNTFSAVDAPFQTTVPEVCYRMNRSEPSKRNRYLEMKPQSRARNITDIWLTPPLLGENDGSVSTMNSMSKPCRRFAGHLMGWSSYYHLWKGWDMRTSLARLDKAEGQCLPSANGFFNSQRDAIKGEVAKFNQGRFVSGTYQTIVAKYSWRVGSYLGRQVPQLCWYDNYNLHGQPFIRSQFG